MLSLKKAADKSGSFTRTEDLEGVGDVVFAGGHTTMEYAMEFGVSYQRPDRRSRVGEFELAENSRTSRSALT